MASLHQLLKTTIEKGASELHVAAGTPPLLEIDGELRPLEPTPLSAPEARRICRSVLTDGQKRELEDVHELEIFFSVVGLARFRARIAIEDGSVGAVFRVAPLESLAKGERG